MQTVTPDWHDVATENGAKATRLQTKLFRHHTLPADLSSPALRLSRSA